MSDQSNQTGGNSGNNDAKPEISLETILSQIPGHPIPGDYHTESLDTGNYEKNGTRLEE